MANSNGKNNYRLTITHDPEAVKTKEEVLNSLAWWYKDILFNNPKLDQYKKDQDTKKMSTFNR